MDWPQFTPDFFGKQNFGRISQDDGAENARKKNHSIGMTQFTFDNDRTHQAHPEKNGKWIDGVNQETF